VTISTPPGVRRREVVGYCFYDFANSSFTTMISTIAFSRYFRIAVVGPNSENGDFLWSLAAATSYLLVIVSGPVLGAIADGSGAKKKFLIGSTVLTVLATASLALAGPGDLWLAFGLFVIASFGFESGYIFYNAFLPEISTRQNMNRISAWSWGTGFIGGLLSVVVCLPLLSGGLTSAASDGAGLSLVPDAVRGHRLSFLVVAAFFLVFSIPTFLFLKERSRVATKRWTGLVRTGFARVWQTTLAVRQHRNIALFVMAATVFYGGIEAVIKFSAIFATVSFNITGQELQLLFIVANLVAVPSTIGAGWLADRVGSKRVLIGTLFVWLVIVFVGAVVQSKVGFWFLACGAASGMGSTQAVARSIMASISPANRESEFFGFYILATKVGAIVVILLFGTIASGTGQQRLAVLGLLPLFLAGILILRRVQVPREAS